MVTKTFISRITGNFDAISEWLGRTVAWLILAMAIATGAVVVVRYALGSGSIALQESISYLHATVFMLGICYTLKHDQHVRVDVFYQGFSDTTRAWVNAIGSIIFIFPLCIFIIFISLTYVGNSWVIREGSADPGGIHGVYLLKTLIPILGVTLLMQAVSVVLTNCATLMSFYGSKE
ncbi:MAG: TRAP-type mannitol/chloroaromatic compound transport system permease small subunit [Pseudomonadales bacterium]|jgi:TRAP-type mannitol/chloroaromatic compound transport system permease small subunit